MRPETLQSRLATDRFTFTSIIDIPTVGAAIAEAAAQSAELMRDVPEFETAQDVYEVLFLSAGLAPLQQAAGGAEQISHLDPRRVGNLGAHFAESVARHLAILRQREKETA
mgnify:CR=1 FL=1